MLKTNRSGKFRKLNTHYAEQGGVAAYIRTCFDRGLTYTEIAERISGETNISLSEPTVRRYASVSSIPAPVAT